MQQFKWLSVKDMIKPEDINKIASREDVSSSPFQLNLLIDYFEILTYFPIYTYDELMMNIFKNLVMIQLNGYEDLLPKNNFFWNYINVYF